MLNCLYVGPPVIHYTPTNCPQVYGHNTIKSGVTVENCATSPHLKTARRRGCVFNFKLNFQKELVLVGRRIDQLPAKM